MNPDECQLEAELLEKLLDLKYESRTDIRDRVEPERNFRQKFEAVNHVRLTDGEIERLLAGNRHRQLTPAASTIPPAAPGACSCPPRNCLKAR
jgi:hypothetical protein